MKERLNWCEACEVLGCSKSTLYRLVANGQLRAFGVGSRGRWYSRTECERFVLDRCGMAVAPLAKAGASG